MQKEDIDKIIELREKGLSLKKISEELDIPKSTVNYMCKQTDSQKVYNYIEKREKNKQILIDRICEAVGKCYTLSQVCSAINKHPNRQTIELIKEIIKDKNLDTSHFKYFYKKNISGKEYTKEEIFCENSTYQTSKLKEKLIKFGIKEYKCERCGRTEWEGEPIPLETHHINGKHNDNRIENLELLCPNCHALTHNYRKKKNCHNKRNKSKKETKQFNIEEILDKFKECGSLTFVSEQMHSSLKTLKKVLNENNIPDDSKGLRAYIIDKYGKQPQWYKYINFEKIKDATLLKSKSVNQYDLNGNLIKKYNYIAETKNYGFTPVSVGKCCKGKLKTHKGFIWKYNDN